MLHSPWLDQVRNLSINGRKNVLKTFDRPVRLQPAKLDDNDDLQVFEVWLPQSEVENSLKRLCFRFDAGKRLKYATGLGGSETIRRFNAKFGNAYSSIKPLTAFNVARTEHATAHMSDENRTQQQQQQQ
ncbi:hypothetical protein V1527DRAFT_481988 [Lipomyces starkeyi]